MRAQAVAISQARFADGGAMHVVLSRDDVFADSLAGTSLLRDGPMLLVAPNGLPSETFTELTRVLSDGGRVYLLGGDSAISVVIEDQLTNLGFDVRRLARPLGRSPDRGLPSATEVSPAPPRRMSPPSTVPPSASRQSRDW